MNFVFLPRLMKKASDPNTYDIKAAINLTGGC